MQTFRFPPDLPSRRKQKKEVLSEEQKKKRAQASQLRQQRNKEKNLDRRQYILERKLSESRRIWGEEAFNTFRSQEFQDWYRKYGREEWKLDFELNKEECVALIQDAVDTADSPFIQHIEALEAFGLRMTREEQKEKDRQRRLKRKLATPVWANMEKIKEIYKKRDRMNAEVGYRQYVVDHIVPLNGQLVSGLHVEYNLQVVSHYYNKDKANRHLTAQN